MELSLPESLIYEKRGRISIITLNRPEAMNSLTREMLVGLEAVFDDFNADPNLLVAIFTGNGERAFCAGADLKAVMPALLDGDALGYDDPAKRPFQNVFKPIISAVNGICVAGGLEFMLGTDIRIASEHAKFGLAEVRWGVVPSGGSHIRLPQQIPWAIAMELLLTGATIDAKRAYEVGLVNVVVSADRLLDEAITLAEKIADNGPLAIRTAKEIVVRALNNEPKFVLEKAIAERVFRSDDAREGARAFAAKDKPAFCGC